MYIWSTIYIENGFGVKKDETMADYWYELSKENQEEGVQNSGPQHSSSEPTRSTPVEETNQNELVSKFSQIQLPPTPTTVFTLPDTPTTGTFGFNFNSEPTASPPRLSELLPLPHLSLVLQQLPLPELGLVPLQ